MRLSVSVVPCRVGSEITMSATVESNWRTKVTNAVEIPILTKCCLCVPLRKGLIAFAYINLLLTLLLTSLLSYYIAYLRINGHTEPSEYPRLILDTAALCIEIVLTIVFIVGLHMRYVLLMKIYLYFEIGFSAFGFIYSIAFMTKETSSEVFLILFQLLLQAYLSILIWSSIVKMQRDGSVKYTREQEEV